MTTNTTPATVDAVRNLIVCDTQFGWNGETTLKLPELLDLQERGWMTEGDDNSEFELTSAGREVVARALESGAPATLATVEHGGCVQLPTSERERFEAWALAECLSLHRYDSGPYSHDRTYSAWLAWQAALSAQPSPGGQGTGVSISDSDRAVLQRLQDALPFAGINGWGKGVEVLERLLRDSLAARQPVAFPPARAVDLGMPIAMIDQALGHLSTALDDLDSSPDRRPGGMVAEAMACLRHALTGVQS